LFPPLTFQSAHPESNDNFIDSLALTHIPKSDFQMKRNAKFLSKRSILNTANDGARSRRIRIAYLLLLAPALVAAADVDSQKRYDDSSTSYFRTASESAWRKKLFQLFQGTESEPSGSSDSRVVDDRDRELNSSSESEEEENYWQIDDYVRRNRDDDFYKYDGDPLPPTLFPITRRDVIGFMFASIGVTLGSSGGIGGGGIVVPVYIIAMGLSPRVAIPLGSVTVLGGSLAGLILNLRRRHPLADRPIIDWDLILVMEPLVLVGALIGAIVHRVISEKILMVLLVLLLSVVAQTTLAKAKRMYNAELRYIEHLKAARWEYLSRVASFRSAFRASGWSAQDVHGEAHESNTCAPLALTSPMGRTQSLDSRSTLPRMDFDEKQRILILNPDFVTLRTDLLEQEKITPRSKVMALLAKFTVLIFLNITLGGGAFRSPWGIQCGSVAFWVVHVIMVAFLISSAWAAQVSGVGTKFNLVFWLALNISLLSCYRRI
jgi:hypothetical protein